MRSSILIIYTGGTIGMKTDAETGALVPFDFSGIYDEFPSLKRLNVDIEVLTLSPVIDSSNVCPDNWLELARLIRDNYARYDGFVVLHGTDTMSYTASALSFLLENLKKPVVFTGSQIPIGVLRTDGRENLITAIEIAGAQRDGRPVVPEVSLYFQDRLFRANRTTKRSAEALNAFRSYNYPALAEVGVNISYNLAAICQPDGFSEEPPIADPLDSRSDPFQTATNDSHRIASELGNPSNSPRITAPLGNQSDALQIATKPCNPSDSLQIATKPCNPSDSLQIATKLSNPSDSLQIATKLGNGIALIKLFPGIDESILRAMLTAAGLRAVVLETFGAGNAPTSEWFIRLLEEAIGRGILIVNITQCGSGSVSMELYETGLRLQKIGVLSGYDLTTEAAVTKLMYLLGKELPAESLREAMRKSLRGEITV